VGKEDAEDEEGFFRRLGVALLRSNVFVGAPTLV
jgi:hypothetical protein